MRPPRIDSGGIDLTNGDGLELDGSTLYVVRNQANRVAVLDLDDDASSVTAVGELASDDFAVPTTAALVGDDLWAVNARFGIRPRPTPRTGSPGSMPADDMDG